MQPESNDHIAESIFSEVKFEYTPQFPEILSYLKASILVTTYQAGKLLVLGAHEGKLQISFLSYDQPMGLAVDRSRIAIGTRKQIQFLVPAHETQQGQDFYDGCFVPRSSFNTGSIHGHELGWGHDGLWINDYFSKFDPQIDTVSDKNKPAFSRLIEFAFDTKFGTITDSVFKVITLKKWKSKFHYMNEEDFQIALKTTKTVSKHHPSNFQKKVIISLNTKLEEVQSKYNVVLQREHV